MTGPRSFPSPDPSPEEPPGGSQSGAPSADPHVPGSREVYPEDDFDLDADFDRWVADVDAGRVRVPEEWEVAGPSVSISLGDASDVDPAALAAMCGPDGLGGEALSAAYGQDKAAETLRPGPILAALTEQAVSDLASLSDNQLTGALSAARRLENRAAYLQVVAIAEFARRREADREEARSRKVPLHCRPGQFPGEELAPELVCTAQYADGRIWEATELTTRLPRTLAGMAAGTIDATRATIIWTYTWSLTPGDAAYADEVLAAVAPGLRPDQLSRKAAALEMKLDPEAVRRRRERTRQDAQRVEVKHERSGNAMLAGRELDPVTALAAKANIDALAVKLREADKAGSLQHLRALVMTELLQGRNPLDRLAPLDRPASAGRRAPGGPESARPASNSPEGPAPGSTVRPAPGSPAWPARDADADADTDWRDDLGYRDEGSQDVDSQRGDGTGPGLPRGAVAPLPALINLLVPAGTVLGWSTAPARVGSWGLLDAEETVKFVQAASLSPRSRFCMTLVAPDGTALAHGCSRGPHPWPMSQPTMPAQPVSPQSQEPLQSQEPPPSPCSPGRPPGQPPSPCSPGRPPGQPPGPGSQPRPVTRGPESFLQPSPEQAQRLADLIRRLNITFRPVAQGRCDHVDAEDHYTPSRQLKHLVRARTTTCTAPACDAQAVFCDLDHTVAYPGGPTCQCNLAPKCRRHHRCKQAPGWSVEQPEPGVMRWTVPSGRTYRTAPTVHEL
jgi:hypothetical protein